MEGHPRPWEMRAVVLPQDHTNATVEMPAARDTSLPKTQEMQAADPLEEGVAVQEPRDFRPRNPVSEMPAAAGFAFAEAAAAEALSRQRKTQADHGARHAADVGRTGPKRGDFNFGDLSHLQ